MVDITESPPIIDIAPNKLSNGYGYYDCVSQAYITVTKIHQNGRGTYAEINIESPAQTPILSRVELCITDYQTRNRIITQLCNDYRELLLQWPLLIEYAFTDTLNKFRLGLPIQELWTNQDITPVEYIIEPFIIKDVPNIFFGEHSSGKTTIALLLTALCELGNDLFNTFGLHISKNYETLFLDYENNSDRTLWKLKAIKDGLELPDLCLRYKNCHLPLSMDIESLKDEIDKNKESLIIIDSLGLAAGGELKEALSATAFYSALRSLNTTSLILAHTSKGLDKKKTVFGSVYFENLARNIWELQKLDINDNTVRIALHHIKHNLTKKYQPIGFEINYDCDRINIINCDPTEEPEFRSKMPISNRALHELSIGNYSTSEIADILGESINSVDHAMKRLEKNNKIEKIDGKWFLI